MNQINKTKNKPSSFQRKKFNKERKKIKKTRKALVILQNQIQDRDEFRKINWKKNERANHYVNNERQNLPSPHRELKNSWGSRIPDKSTRQRD